MNINLRYININWINKIRYINISRVFIYNKRDVAFALFTFGIAINIFASIHVMYFWPIEAYCPLVTMPLFVFACLLSNSISTPIFTRKDFILPTLFSLLIQYYQSFVNAQNLVPYIISSSSIVMYYCMFSINKKKIFDSMTYISKCLAFFLIFSLFFFFIHYLGFNLPNIPSERGNYSYTNYFFFLFDDRELWNILLPRFNSVFLEPGHLGTTLVMILATQIGQWKKWYNIVMIIAAIFTFSLAAYCLAVILLFLRLWILRKKIMAKIIILISSISIVVGGSFLYNDGDNLLNTLIVSRLEMNDSGDDFKGNNRVSENFEKEFISFLSSSDVLLGRDMDYEGFGNSGYMVYIYDHGLLGLFGFLAFYYFAFRTGKDKRAIISAFILSMTNFWIRGYPLLLAFFFPYFLISQLEINIKEKNLLKNAQ